VVIVAMHRMPGGEVAHDTIASRIATFPANELRH